MMYSRYNTQDVLYVTVESRVNNTQECRNVHQPIEGPDETSVAVASTNVLRKAVAQSIAFSVLLSLLLAAISYRLCLQ